MKTWTLDNRTVYELSPLREYLSALGTALSMPREDQRLVLVTGESGSGKTIGARLFCQEAKLRPLYLSLPAEQLLRPSVLLETLARVCNVTLYAQGRYHAASAILEDSRREPRVLVLDNAQALRRGGLLDILRWIADEGAHTFVLVGNPQLEHTFRERQELRSRVLFRHALRLPSCPDLAPLFDGFPPEVVEQVHTKTGGRLREVMALRRWLLELTEENRLERGKLTAKHVRSVSGRVLVEAA